jgi:uncharacterized protein with HEPN domain
MSKRGDVESLKDILESANRIQRYVGSSTLAEFMANTQAQDAVVRNLSIIGEAAKNLSTEFRKRHEEVEWAKIAGLRDRLVHDYFSLDWDILWDVVQTRIPRMKGQVAKVLDEAAE